MKCHQCISILVLAFSLFACEADKAYLTVTVEDPDGIAANAVKVLVGQSFDELSSPEPLSDFPAIVVLQSREPTESAVVIEVQDQANSPVARARTSGRFRRGNPGTAVATLAKYCIEDAECQDDLFCDGTGFCRDNVCEYEDQPCGSSFPCVTSTCVEEVQTCDVTVDHYLCPEGSYCDTGAGCVEGPRCMTDADCDNGLLCDGMETCSRFRCEAGSLPEVDDEDICTLDGCNDARIDDELDPLFNIAQDNLDGSSCTIPPVPHQETDTPEAPGVCVAAKNGCVGSVCGDGVVDVNSTPPEVCDDGPLNGNDWSLDPHCNADCTGLAQYCGDGATGACSESQELCNTDTDCPTGETCIANGNETCDDGSRTDNGNGCSNTCQRNDGGCGNGVIAGLFEECDDGAANTDNCDGCTTSCHLACFCGSPFGCEGGQWCDANATCRVCNTKEHCGPNCEPCRTAQWCDESTGCLPCDTEAHCGPDCVACESAGPTPICGGEEVGCVASSCVGKTDFTRCSLVTTPDYSYDICADEVCVSPGACNDAMCNSPGPSFVLPDTAQRNCFDDTSTMACPGTAGDASCATTAHCGQDGQYGWDPDPGNTATDRFTRTVEVVNAVNGTFEPVVRDNVTNLVWLGCPAGLSDSLCDYGGVAAFAWSGALTYCENLPWGGYNDWRLPDVFALRSIVDYGTFSPAIDQTAFPATTKFPFWTSSSSASGTTMVWVVNFGTGRVGISLKIDSIHVRCVRGGP